MCINAQAGLIFAFICTNDLPNEFILAFKSILKRRFRCGFVDCKASLSLRFDVCIPCRSGSRISTNFRKAGT